LGNFVKRAAGIGEFCFFCIFNFQNFLMTEAFALLEYYPEFVVYEDILGRMTLEDGSGILSRDVGDHLSKYCV
jgi:hypothetical protein